MGNKNPYWPAFKWWLVGSEKIVASSHSAVAHNNCNHRNYLLTCAQYERLISRAAGRCEICGTRDIDNPHGKLYIDHVHRLGKWAVRGLLCQPCNSSLRSPWGRALTTAYAESAFYLTLLLEAGLDSITPPEPEQMSVVHDYANRPWRREPEGWWLHWLDQNNDPQPHSWNRLIFRFGPHNLAPTEFAQPNVPLMGPRVAARLSAKYARPLSAFAAESRGDVATHGSLAPIKAIEGA